MSHQPELAGAAGPGRVQLRFAGDGPVLEGHFAVFNQWTEIDSMFEGRFLEQIAPGAFRRSLAEHGDSVRVLLEHGMDAVAGNRPLGAIQSVAEDRVGVAYAVPLFADADYVRELLPALGAGQYGASFRFRVQREELVMEPPASSHNPQGLPERTLLEVALAEFGPVTFPAYHGATAGLRSETTIAPTRGRPPRTIAGEGMLTPIRAITLNGQRLRPGVSRIAPDHELVRARPADFRPVMPGDQTPSVRAHVRRRGSGRARSVAAHSLRPQGRKAAPAWQL